MEYWACLRDVCELVYANLREVSVLLRYSCWNFDESLTRAFARDEKSLGFTLGMLHCYIINIYTRKLQR